MGRGSADGGTTNGTSFSGACANLPVPVSLSPSKLNSYGDCPQLFRFRYIDKLPEPDSPEALRGTAVHEALERLYQQDPPDRDAFSMVLPDEEAQALAENITALENPRQVDVIATELLVEQQGEPVLRGIIDRVDRGTNGGVVLIDYKTGKTPNERVVRDRLHGLMFYARMYESLYDTEVERISLYYLREPVAISAQPEEHTIRGVNMRIAAMWDAIVRACETGNFKPRPGPLCSWCSYQAICPSFSSESPANGFSGTDPQGGTP